jgi:hypothetical protein
MSTRELRRAEVLGRVKGQTLRLVDAAKVLDRGNSDFDIRHSFTAGVTYALPAPGLQKVVRALLGDWSLDTFVLARSAPPVDIVGAQIVTAGTTFEPRPDVVPGMPLELYGSQYPGGKIFQ